MGITTSGTANAVDPVSAALSRLDVAADKVKTLMSRWDDYCQEFKAFDGAPFETRHVAMTGRVELVARLPLALPPALAVDARHAVMEARSALDNLVSGMTTLRGGSSALRRTAAFPIVDRGRDAHWPDREARMLLGIDAGTRANIRAVQPFLAARGPGLHPLTFLSRTCNQDKHRHPLTVGLRPAFGAGSSMLASTQYRDVTPDEAQQWKSSIGRKSPDILVDVEIGVINPGDVLVSLAMPRFTRGDFHVAFTDPALTLVALMEGEGVPGPLIPQLRNAVRFAREVVLYVAGEGENPEAWAAPEVSKV